MTDSEADCTELDVLIVGAGISGIGAGYHLQNDCPGLEYLIVEGRPRLGGTWDLFRYPGIRSDSDMYTLGYSFRPWTDPKAIADGPSILRYLEDTAAEYGIDQRIRYDHRVVSAEWSSDEARWTVHVDHDGKRRLFRVRFLMMCTGYYRYSAGYTPNFPGVDSFDGDIIHPQKWPEAFNYDGKRIIIIGSGATAVTLLPSLARAADHVTMLQRSPTYIASAPGKDPLAEYLRGKVSPKHAYRAVRAKNIAFAIATYNFCRRYPDRAKRFLRRQIRERLGPDYDVDRHFSPRYDPWDQRVCLAPDGDFFDALISDKASIVTDHIDRFTRQGIRLKSGQELAADIIITATGLQLEFLGGIPFTVDGEPVRANEKMVYKGMMLSDVPNVALASGYTNASWTLKCDLTCEYACRLLNHQSKHGYRAFVPRQRDPSLGELPLLGLSSGYIRRSVDEMPKQGDRSPWRLYQNYVLDLIALRYGRLEDGVMEFVS